MKLPLIALTMLLASTSFAMSADMACLYNPLEEDGVDYPALCDAIEQSSIGSVAAMFVYDPIETNRLVISLATTMPVSFRDREAFADRLCDGIAEVSPSGTILSMWNSTEFRLNGSDFATLARGVLSKQLPMEISHYRECEN